MRANSPTQGISLKMHQARPLFLVTVALQLIGLGYSYQSEGDGAREVSNILSPVIPGTTLDRTLSNSSRKNDIPEGARLWDSLPDSSTLGESAVPVSRCCHNGGTCVLGSFCVCPAYFTGRYCEHDQRRRDCGALGHGAWTLHSCRLCRCIFSALYCLPHQTFSHCDLKSFLSSGARGSRECSIPSLLLLVLCLLLQGVAGKG
ncbi:cryptic protein precursor [Mus musculus]|uniref:Cryptic protein n=1 Tax=Mus musculus TaxID=10090 RepID=CFC1_MOUSE|nr:cryptic protein precursor [Mus musculus]P97766.1 RecName: Full=Cryptic protein; Flags: Precursor [Mus musculus]AAC53042.1 CRYPTIC [Mus musculus]AAI00706.1 Cripto, FRL-1, cryptic family 1 [Mus musculus]AAI00709.1 Cripto, FRL-1, cryptic family 1 [Mus musculus]AAI00712.1 Cripto, FRL-1, cryptic family 1 [Mus musculus]EDL14455.1 cripto, FRL-1, cryptic family 1 [Mus musculus]|eukprot:NP_031711.1 cryptic protein precursor [Mus musculus]